MTDTETKVAAFAATQLARIDSPRPIHTAYLHSPLACYGLKALDVIEIVMAAEAYYGVELRDEDLEQPISIASIARHVDRLRSVNA